MNRMLLLGLASCALGVPVWADEPVQAPIVQPDNILTIPAPVNKPASEWTDDEIKALGQGVAFPYSLLDRTLNAYVNKEGAITYIGLKGDQNLELFTRALALASTDKFPTFKEKGDDGNEVIDQSAELVFWINAYNGLFLHTVGEKYPIDSISDIPNFDTQKTHIIGGTVYSFADLRQKIIKLDPRGLFVLIDGTRSGPRAPQGAARFFALGAQLNAAIKAYINDPLRVSAPNRLQNEVFVSPWLRDIDKAFENRSIRQKYSGIRYLLGSYTTISADQRYYNAGAYEIKFMPPLKGLYVASSRG